MQVYYLWTFLMLAPIVDSNKTEKLRLDIKIDCPKTGTYGSRTVEKPQQYMVLIANIDEQRVCGGTLINSEWVLTAAYCITRKKPTTDIQAIFNVHDIKKRIFVLGTAHVHPLYDFNVADNAAINDIGLLQLNAPVTGMEYMKLSNKPIKKGQHCHIVGWSITSFIFNNQDNELVIHFNNGMLFKEYQILIDQSRASYIFGPEIESRGCLCTVRKAHSFTLGPSAAQYGGPFVCDGSQVGVVSGKPYETIIDEKYLMWPKLTHYSDWITRTIEGGEQPRIEKWFKQDRGEEPYKQVTAKQSRKDQILSDLICCKRSRACFRCIANIIQGLLEELALKQQTQPARGTAKMTPKTELNTKDPLIKGQQSTIAEMTPKKEMFTKEPCIEEVVVCTKPTQSAAGTAKMRPKTGLNTKEPRIKKQYTIAEMIPKKELRTKEPCIEQVVMCTKPTHIEESRVNKKTSASTQKCTKCAPKPTYTKKDKPIQVKICRKAWWPLQKKNIKTTSKCMKSQCERNAEMVVDNFKTWIRNIYHPNASPVDVKEEPYVKNTCIQGKVVTYTKPKSVEEEPKQEESMYINARVYINEENEEEPINVITCINEQNKNEKQEEALYVVVYTKKEDIPEEASKEKLSTTSIEEGVKTRLKQIIDRLNGKKIRVKEAITYRKPKTSEKSNINKKHMYIKEEKSDTPEEDAKEELATKKTCIELVICTKPKTPIEEASIKEDNIYIEDDKPINVNRRMDDTPDESAKEEPCTKKPCIELITFIKPKTPIEEATINEDNMYIKYDKPINMNRRKDDTPYETAKEDPGTKKPCIELVTFIKPKTLLGEATINEDYMYIKDEKHINVNHRKDNIPEETAKEEPGTKKPMTPVEEFVSTENCSCPQNIEEKTPIKVVSSRKEKALELVTYTKPKTPMENATINEEYMYIKDDKPINVNRKKDDTPDEAVKEEPCAKKPCVELVISAKPNTSAEELVLKEICPCIPTIKENASIKVTTSRKEKALENENKKVVEEMTIGTKSKIPKEKAVINEDYTYIKENTPIKEPVNEEPYKIEWTRFSKDEPKEAPKEITNNKEWKCLVKRLPIKLKIHTTENAPITQKVAIEETHMNEKVVPFTKLKTPTKEEPANVVTSTKDKKPEKAPKKEPGTKKPYVKKESVTRIEPKTSMKETAINKKYMHIKENPINMVACEECEKPEKTAKEEPNPKKSCIKVMPCPKLMTPKENLCKKKICTKYAKEVICDKKEQPVQFVICKKNKTSEEVVKRELGTKQLYSKTEIVTCTKSNTPAEQKEVSTQLMASKKEKGLEEAAKEEPCTNNTGIKEEVVPCPKLKIPKEEESTYVKRKIPIKLVPPKEEEDNEEDPCTTETCVKKRIAADTKSAIGNKSMRETKEPIKMVTSKEQEVNEEDPCTTETCTEKGIAMKTKSVIGNKPMRETKKPMVTSKEEVNKEDPTKNETTQAKSNLCGIEEDVEGESEENIDQGAEISEQKNPKESTWTKEKKLPKVETYYRAKTAEEACKDELCTIKWTCVKNDRLMEVLPPNTENRPSEAAEEEEACKKGWICIKKDEADRCTPAPVDLKTRIKQVLHQFIDYMASEAEPCTPCKEETCINEEYTCKEEEIPEEVSEAVLRTNIKTPVKKTIVECACKEEETPEKESYTTNRRRKISNMIVNRESCPTPKTPTEEAALKDSSLEYTKEYRAATEEKICGKTRPPIEQAALTEKYTQDADEEETYAKTKTPINEEYTQDVVEEEPRTKLRRPVEVAVINEENAQDATEKQMRIKSRTLGEEAANNEKMKKRPNTLSETAVINEGNTKDAAEEQKYKKPLALIEETANTKDETCKKYKCPRLFGKKGTEEGLNMSEEVDKSLKIEATLKEILEELKAINVERELRLKKTGKEEGLGTSTDSKCDDQCADIKNKSPIKVIVTKAEPCTKKKNCMEDNDICNLKTCDKKPGECIEELDPSNLETSIKRMLNNNPSVMSKFWSKTLEKIVYKIKKFFCK